MRKVLIGLLLTTLAVSGVDVFGEVTRASRWVDRVVLTSEGELLGRVEDFALEEESLKVSYIVVSVGSYLIEQNLIAVTPDSLQESDDGAYLVIAAEALLDAPRFAAEAWPEEAQIDSPPLKAASQASGAASESDSGSAEIVAAHRRLTVDNEGKMSVTEIEQPQTAISSGGVTPKTYRTGIIDDQSGEPQFSRFDVNKDGYLSRREIAPYFGPGLKFSSFDTDGNGGLDPFELEVLKSRQ
ncbi:MAG: hypothetical protein GKR90_04330 [Pseudomonadales bacterium]|nr:hypothetical protein [Pseudomonadales bacterium]